MKGEGLLGQELGTHKGGFSTFRFDLLKDAEGNVVGRAGAPAKNHTDILISVKEPHLWNGMEDPYCYTAVAKLLVGEEVVDEVEVIYGYRSFHVDPNTGFWLNEKNVPLHGVSEYGVENIVKWHSATPMNRRILKDC